MLHVKQFAFNPFAESTFVVFDETSREAAVVDPGMASEAERSRLDTFIRDNKLKITQIINTHLHVDHCFGANYVRSRYGVPVKANNADAFLGESVAAQTRTFGVIPSDGQPAGVAIDEPLNDGDTIKIGSDSLKVLHVPATPPAASPFTAPTAASSSPATRSSKAASGAPTSPAGAWTNSSAASAPSSSSSPTTPSSSPATGRPQP